MKSIFAQRIRLGSLLLVLGVVTANCSRHHSDDQSLIKASSMQPAAPISTLIIPKQIQPKTKRKGDFYLPQRHHQIDKRDDLIVPPNSHF